MNILVLGVNPSPLTTILKRDGYNVLECFDSIDIEFLRNHRIHFAVSYRYRSIIKKPIIDFLRGRIINLHISLLPFNRGADPNLWSFLENTPKGVTIHYVDSGLDTGDIIAQKEIDFDVETETLATTYDKLNTEIIHLFEEHWPLIIKGKASRWKQY